MSEYFGILTLDHDVLAIQILISFQSRHFSPMNSELLKTPRAYALGPLFKFLTDHLFVSIW